MDFHQHDDENFLLLLQGRTVWFLGRLEEKSLATDRRFLRPCRWGRDHARKAGEARAKAEWLRAVAQAPQIH